MKSEDVGRLRDQFEEPTKRANEQLGSFDDDTIGMGRYVPGSSPWERHSNGYELLPITDGEVEMEILEDDGRSCVDFLGVGSLFVVPKGLWHHLTASVDVNISHLSPAEDGAERTSEHPIGGRATWNGISDIPCGYSDNRPVRSIRHRLSAA